MDAQYRELPGLRVTLDKLLYMPQLDAPGEKPHPFAYFLTIHNDSDSRVVLLRRKWLVRETSGELQVFEGAGIVGQTPELGPGEAFSYNSYHVTAMGAEASGAFFGEASSGEQVAVRIPSFRLLVP